MKIEEKASLAFCRFDVGRDLHFDESRGRVNWDATVPIPSTEGPLPGSKMACCHLA